MKVEDHSLVIISQQLIIVMLLLIVVTLWQDVPHSNTSTPLRLGVNIEISCIFQSATTAGVIEVNNSWPSKLKCH